MQNPPSKNIQPCNGETTCPGTAPQQIGHFLQRPGQYRKEKDGFLTKSVLTTVLAIMKLYFHFLATVHSSSADSKLSPRQLSDNVPMRLTKKTCLLECPSCHEAGTGVHQLPRLGKNAKDDDLPNCLGNKCSFWMPILLSLVA